MKKITPAAILRARALDALKATWPTVLAGSALINLASYVLNQVLDVIPGLGAFLSILVMALLTVPMMGLTSGVLGYYRGKPLTFDSVKAMFPHWQKVCMLYLWTMLRLFGWMLPGAAVMAVGGAMLVLGTDGTAIIAFGGLLLIAGMIVMIIPACRAAFSYSMSNCILIDDPSTGARDALNKSKAMIHGYRWHYVKVSLPVFIVLFAVIFVIGALTAALPAWLASLISSVISVFTGMLSYYFMPVMYEELKRIGR
ncbi:MAG: DUF975 family protein [Clostridia bacterium]|nr:DUF975 family protein [Clostridia bacterium]